MFIIHNLPIYNDHKNNFLLLQDANSVYQNRTAVEDLLRDNDLVSMIASSDEELHVGRLGNDAILGQRFLAFAEKGSTCVPNGSR